MKVSSSVWVAAAVAIVGTLAVSGCGDSSSGGGAGAGASANIGEPCLAKACASGLICDGALFDSACTVQCNSDSACEVWTPNARCFGTTTRECGLRCDTDKDCPSGSTCRGVSGGTTPLACLRQ